MAKVIVGLSGGVDSAVAAYLLQKQGYEVCGVTLRTWNGMRELPETERLPGTDKLSEPDELPGADKLSGPDELPGTDKLSGPDELPEADKLSGPDELSGPDPCVGSRCREIDDARKIARLLGIRYYVLNCVPDFTANVVEPFVRDYLQGKTPNPCIGCNRSVKWEKMRYAAGILQADYVATGHYAHVLRLPNGRYTVRQAFHAAKDQTYMLCRLTQEDLAMTRMPLGDYSKEEVRRIALEIGLPVADKPDSQEICFVTDGHYADFIEEFARSPLSSGSGPWKVPGPGNFVDENGKILGTHKGITHYTIGQRKGLGIALGHPAYVREIRPGTDEVVLSEETSLFHTSVLCRSVNFLSIPGMVPGEKLRARSKIRYHHAAADSTLEMQADGSVLIHFDVPVRAPAPGQSAVFYDQDDCVIGGGLIVSG